jgi:hypothetical protein
VRKFGYGNAVHPMIRQIPCLLAQANFPLNAPVCHLPSFLNQVSQKSYSGIAAMEGLIKSF